ncbi:MAG: YqgE/AlgH family protein [Leptospirales bacterium]|nr:YqgE/AlgH family protein [Leptospirales bacterium]
MSEAGNPFFRPSGHGGPRYPSSLKGYFLISESNMPDPNFFQTVVLMLEHNEEGAFGLVVNRRSKLSLADILPRLDSPRSRSTPVYVGGPVQQEFLFVVHSEIADHQPSAAAVRPAPRVIFEPSFSNVEKFFKDEFWEAIPADDRPKIHLFLGYSGWASGQLESELKLGSWIHQAADAQIVFHPDPETGWKEALRKKGGIYRVFADSDQNPALN